MDGQVAMFMKIGAPRAGPRRSAHTGYQEAFVEAYQRYYTKVFAYVYSRIGNVEAAKDLTSEVFEKAYVKGHSLREPAAYSTWLFMIAKNVVVGHYRRHKREVNGINKIKESLWLSEQPPNPENDALLGEALSNLMVHLRQLSVRDQELLSLKFEGELSYAEIARVLHMSEVNVRVSMFRALKRLRDLMKEEAR
jgi:RNA polymerase sigma-70 factor (ECF subfamily)